MEPLGLWELRPQSSCPSLGETSACICDGRPMCWTSFAPSSLVAIPRLADLRLLLPWASLGNGRFLANSCPSILAKGLGEACEAYLTKRRLPRQGCVPNGGPSPSRSVRSRLCAHSPPRPAQSSSTLVSVGRSGWSWVGHDTLGLVAQVSSGSLWVASRLCGLSAGTVVLRRRSTPQNKTRCSMHRHAQSIGKTASCRIVCLLFCRR